MKFIIAVTVFSILAIGVADAKPNEWRIIEGEEAKPGQFPYQISIRYLGSHNCGGTILSQHWIVTAAHCIDGYKPQNLTVVTGTNKLSEGGDEYKVEKCISHEEYDFLDIVNDIGLVKTILPIEYTKRVQSISIYPEFIPAETPLTVSGWGSIDLGGPLPDDLQYLDVVAIDQKECQERQEPYIVDAGMICTYTKKGQGTCHGDSGSPLTHNNMIVGIVSWGRPCAKGYPDVFTRISYFEDWVKDIMNNN